MAVSLQLLDTSVLARRKHPVVQSWYLRFLGSIATCDMIKLEVLHSARDGKEFDAMELELDSFHHCRIVESEWLRAIDVYRALAGQGGMHQRSVKQPDLLIAAAAEAAGARLVHYDEDFDRISAITGQETLWVAPRGSL